MGGELKAARWAKKHGTLVKPFRLIKVAGSDMQSKAPKFLREVMDSALEKEGNTLKNVAKAKSLTRVLKKSKPLIGPLMADKSKPLIGPLMADDAARFLKEVERLALGYPKVTLLLLLNTGMRPEEMLAIRAGNIATVAALMEHASSAYALDPHAAYVPNTGIGIGARYPGFLWAAA